MLHRHTITVKNSKGATLMQAVTECAEDATARLQGFVATLQRIYGPTRRSTAVWEKHGNTLTFHGTETSAREADARCFTVDIAPA